jgi:Fe-S-cluster containining protein
MDALVPPVVQQAFDRERAVASARASSDAAVVRSETVRMYGRLATLQRDVIAQRSVDVACERGCHYCCHLRVEIRPHEAFVLAKHIAGRFSNADRAATITRIEANLQRIAPLSAAAHVRAGIPCALLDEQGTCSVYDARPAACRKYYSVSVSTCRNAFLATSAPLTGELEDEAVRLAGNAVALGHAQGLEDAGFDAALYELHHALLKALTDPKAAKRYRHRKKAFVDGK